MFLVDVRHGAKWFRDGRFFVNTKPLVGANTALCYHGGMNKLKVLVIGGGISSEREVSLKSAENVAASLPAEKYEVSNFELKKAVVENGSFVSELLRLKPNVVFLALHGKYGEDGTIQGMLDLLGVPYTGSGVLASSLAMDKSRCSAFIATQGVHVPTTLSFERGALLIAIESKVSNTFGFPCVVKPSRSGSSIGVSIVKQAEYLTKALTLAFAEDSRICVQQFIQGREFTCGILGNNDQHELMALPVVEIVPHQGAFFDYLVKTQPLPEEEICPAQIDAALTKSIQKTAKLVHRALGCDGLTRNDFILTPAGELYYLETNTIPGLTEASLCPKEARAARISYGDFLSKQIELAISRFQKDRK